jgi:mono/diheme cytochrome c family protein
MRHVLLLCIAVPGTVLEVRAANVEFEKDVRPILQSRCLTCHGPEKSRGALRLDRKALALKGGDSGVAIVPGRSSASPLVQRITSKEPAERMPPKGEPLTSEQITILKRWIDEGAEWPQATTTEEMHWAFKPVIRVEPPAVRDTTWPRNAIDRFVLSRLERNGLKPSPEASVSVLLRRLSFDLTGLPPSPEEIAGARLADYASWVEEKLTLPRFGERWARHWLDVVRFAESDGFETNQPRPNAWPYRDYVIRAFNSDKPYDQFIKEQLAGDLLGQDAATGFLVGGPYDRVKSPDPVLTAQQRADELHDMIGVVGTAFLGMTVGCARCHSHKFDPISQVDYYAMKALLEGVQHGERSVRGPADAADDALAAPPGSKRPAQRRPAVQTGRNIDHFEPIEARFVRFTIRATNSLEPCLDEIEVFGDTDKTNHALSATVRASSTLPGHAIHKLEHLTDGRYGNQYSWISNEKGKGWVQLEWAKPRRIDRVVWSRDRRDPPLHRDRIPMDYLIEVSQDGKEWKAVASAFDRGEATTVLYAGRMTTPAPTKRLHRGDVTQPREVVAPALPASIGPSHPVPNDAGDPQRRLALANWIVDPRHPLTARVIVNRLWQHHFGTGLVDTPSDFGKNGGKPTHPELLDWLASELIANGWSLRHVHRLIVTSATYRQSSRAQDAGLAKDAQTRLLWRYPPRRLEAEALRDSILAVSGKLDLTMGGPGFDLFEPNSNYVKVYTPRKEFGPETFRRMVYQSKWRMQIDDTFGAFDCPDGGQIAPRRTSSTTPLQALNLLNSPFLVQQSEFFAERLRREANEPAAQVRRAFLLAFGRAPSMEEQRAALELSQTHGLVLLCRALFNANEFVYVR